MVRDVHGKVLSPDDFRGGWAVKLGLVQSDNPYDAETITRQINALLGTWPIGIGVLGAGVIPTLFSARHLTSPLVIVSLMLATLSLAALLPRIRAFADLKPELKTRTLCAVSGLVGAGYGLLFRDAGNSSQAYLAYGALAAATLVTTMTMSRMPAAMLAYTAGLAGTTLAIGSNPLLVLFTLPQAVSAAIVVARIAHSEFKASRRRAVAETEAVRSSRLLTEFEQSGPGWFWETDRNGMISYISPKVCRWLGLKEDALVGKPLAEIADEASMRDDDAPLGERTLSFYISTRTAFVDVPVRAANPDEERWWSVSGRPVLDKYGQFRGLIGSGNDLTEKRKSEAEVSRLARFDPLTGLANRSETGKLLAQAVGNPAAPRPVGLMLIDLDRFKNVNDTMGHPAGDALLKQVSERLLNAAGKVGQVGRLGGDEFKIVFPGLADPQQLAAIAEGIISSVSRPYLIQEKSVTIGASIGIAISPHDGTSADELVRNADLALYAAKEAGRGVHRFYESGMHSAAQQRREIENDLRRALADGEFFLVYQPIVSVGTEKIMGFETLIRWRHPTLGLISPAKFIPVAEECGLIEQIGEWVLRTACKEAVRWAVEARVAVNVSAIQFANPRLPTVVTQALAQSGLSADRLELEITEGVFVADGPATDRQFDTLKGLGVRLALDDFGTGYSSLGYLKRAPFDKIKIDQSFVRGAALGAGHNRNAAIIRAIVTLAETLGMETTAEGVETQDEIELIRNLGCSHIQGFVYGKPLEPGELRRQLGERGTVVERVGHQRSRPQRYRVLRTADLTVEGITSGVRLRNISPQGAALEYSGWASVGTPISLAITDGPTVPGEIRWVKEGRIGLKFAGSLDLRLLSSQMARTG